MAFHIFFLIVSICRSTA